jgi:hypothetical protein
MTLEMGKPLKSAVDFPELKRVVELHQAAGEPARSDQSVRSCNACRTVQPDALVLDLLRERIRQASEPAHAHPHREVLALHVLCAYVKIGRNGETLDPCAGRTPNRHGHYEPHIPEVFSVRDFFGKAGGRLTEAPASGRRFDHASTRIFSPLVCSAGFMSRL